MSGRLSGSTNTLTPWSSNTRSLRRRVVGVIHDVGEPRAAGLAHAEPQAQSLAARGDEGLDAFSSSRCERNGHCFNPGARFQCRAQCIFDDQQPAKFLGRDCEFAGPVSGRSREDRHRAATPSRTSHNQAATATVWGHPYALKRALFTIPSAIFSSKSTAVPSGCRPARPWRTSARPRPVREFAGSARAPGSIDVRAGSGCAPAGCCPRQRRIRVERARPQLRRRPPARAGARLRRESPWRPHRRRRRS